MAQIFESVSRLKQLELAIQTASPVQIARTFATHAGQFYDRVAFDTLARQVHDLYAATSRDSADSFRIQLDRRLCDRYHEPVAWDIASDDPDRQA